MSPTYCDGEFWIAKNLWLAASVVGEVVIFKVDQHVAIKRVIAVPDDSVRILRGKIIRNGHALEEPYICENFRSIGESWPIVGAAMENSVQVPSTSIFVLGDNRGDSLDSRMYGFVHHEQVMAKPMYRLWPFNKRQSCDCSAKT